MADRNDVDSMMFQQKSYQISLQNRIINIVSTSNRHRINIVSTIGSTSNWHRFPNRKEQTHFSPKVKVPPKSQTQIPKKYQNGPLLGLGLRQVPCLGLPAKSLLGPFQLAARQEKAKGRRVEPWTLASLFSFSDHWANSTTERGGPPLATLSPRGPTQSLPFICCCELCSTAWMVTYIGYRSWLRNAYSVHLTQMI